MSKKDLAVLFVTTSNAGVSYYRAWTWTVAAERQRAFHALCPWFQYDLNSTHPWEVDLRDPQHYSRIHNELWSHYLRADVVVMQMVHTPDALRMFHAMKDAAKDARLIPLRKQNGIEGGRPPVIVAEIDDHMLSTADYNPASPFYAPGSEFRSLAVEQFRAADAILTSTNYLAEVYAELNPNVHVIPNSLDFKVWDRVQKKAHKGIRIGWMGGSSHGEDLRIIEPVVRNILAKHKNVKFCFVHGAPDFLKGIRGVECISKFSRIDKYPGFIGGRGFDIGLAPLVDNAFNRGKSNLRWLEYAGMRVPCVASNVGHFKETLRPGVDALLADPGNSVDEATANFQTALEVLITDKARRRQIGNAAYERARKDFNIDTNVHKLEAILRGIVEAGPTVEPAGDILPELSAPGVYQ